MQTIVHRSIEQWQNTDIQKTLKMLLLDDTHSFFYTSISTQMESTCHVHIQAYNISWRSKAGGEFPAIVFSNIWNI